MTKQEIFDKVAKHLLEQGRRCVDEFGNCRYRGTDGTKCAVGAIIPDDEYDECMEGHDVGWVVEEVIPRLKPHLDMLLELQAIHDHTSTALWPDDLDEVAAKYELRQVRND